MGNNIELEFPYCYFGLSKVSAILLHNAVSPLEKQIEFVNIFSGDPRVKRAEAIFGKGRVACPSDFIGGKFSVGVFSAEHEYEFLKHINFNNIGDI